MNKSSKGGSRPPWGPFSWLRTRLRNVLFRLVRRILDTNEGRNLVIEALRGQYASPVSGLGVSNAPAPYPGLGGGPPAPGGEGEGEGMVIVTGRFRSGSTLLWNLFRHMNGFTAYYEPHNERRWFDPATRGSRVDPTHKQVREYWAEYEGLTELGRLYHEEWTRRNLFMDEHAWDPDLLEYTRVLIAKASGRAVLQCNRVDFRLAWFRRYFPRCRIVHLYRHPRDQWCSALMDIKSFPPDGKTSDFVPHDHFYLLSWCDDLSSHFPFLTVAKTSHPYQLFYYLWKLSYLFGRQQSDHSLSLEQLVADPEGELSRLFAAVDIDPLSQDVHALLKLIEKPRFGKWKEYAPEDWFRRHEEVCEQTLADFFGAGGLPREQSSFREERLSFEIAEPPLVSAE